MRKQVRHWLGILVTIFISQLVASKPLLSQEPWHISSALMRSTFKLQGSHSLGTVFIIGQPVPADPRRGYCVLITAAHVLEAMQEESAILHLRIKDGETFKRLPFPIPIRKEGKPLWVRHPDADIAALRVSLPTQTDIQLVSTDMLASDEELRKFDIRPGDELLVLGYPFGAESNAAGFPILRSGRIASYPLVPTRVTKTFLLDFPVFEGNSGGPVFIYHENRIYGGTVNIGSVNFILGLVSEEQEMIEKIPSLTEIITRKHNLSLAVIVHAAFIRELIARLPPPADGEPPGGTVPVPHGGLLKQ
jgi:S1-C subfamily serine protease